MNVLQVFDPEGHIRGVSETKRRHYQWRPTHGPRFQCQIWPNEHRHKQWTSYL